MLYIFLNLVALVPVEEHEFKKHAVGYFNWYDLYCSKCNSVKLIEFSVQKFIIRE